jgi:hypothetical protein
MDTPLTANSADGEQLPVTDLQHCLQFLFQDQYPVRFFALLFFEFAGVVCSTTYSVLVRCALVPLLNLYFQLTSCNLQ